MIGMRERAEFPPTADRVNAGFGGEFTALESVSGSVKRKRTRR